MCLPVDRIIMPFIFLQTRILEWVALPTPRDLPDPGMKPFSLTSSALISGFFTASAMLEATEKGQVYFTMIFFKKGILQAVVVVVCDQRVLNLNASWSYKLWDFSKKLSFCICKMDMIFHSTNVY